MNAKHDNIGDPFNHIIIRFLSDNEKALCRHMKFIDK